MKNQVSLLPLVNKTLSGDSKALEDLLVALKTFINMVIRSKLDCPNDAEDIAQEVALRVCKRIATLRHPEALKTWIHKIIIHECLRYLTSQQTIVPEDPGIDIENDLVEKDPSCLPSEHAEQLELYTEILRILISMPKTTRYMLALHYGTEMGYREIATLLKQPIGTVSSTILRARKRLSKALKDY